MLLHTKILRYNWKYNEIFLTDSCYLCFGPSYRNVISGCHHEVDENCALLVCYTVSSGNSLLTHSVIAQKSAFLNLETFNKTVLYLKMENCLWDFMFSQLHWGRLKSCGIWCSVHWYVVSVGSEECTEYNTGYPVWNVNRNPFTATSGAV